MTRLFGSCCSVAQHLTSVTVTLQHSNHAFSETLSDSSARNVFFFFSNNITGGLIKLESCGFSETLSDSSAGNVFSFLMISQADELNANHMVRGTLSKRSARNVFFLSNDITGGLIKFKPCG